MKSRLLLAFLLSIVAGLQTIKAQTSYDLWIAGIQVTSSNMNDLTELVAELDEEAMERYFNGEMEITFDGNQTLTLKNAIIKPEAGVYGIQSKLQNLNIKLIGENTIGVSETLGIYLQKNPGAGATTFLGDGSLYITSNSGALRTFRNVVIKDGANITAKSTGDASGMQGRPLIVGGDGPTLTLQGEGTELRAFGGSVGSLTNFKELNLSDGLEIIEPAGATYAENVGVVILNRYVANQWVVIAKPEPEAYACYTSENTTLTFYCDNLRSSRTGTTYDLNTGANAPDWYNDNTNASVTQVVFDASFTNARPTTTFAWFYEMRNLQTITGMEYLNTSEVTNMGFMFAYCESLASLDVSSFNTAKVTSMYAMFYDCPSLLSLDVSNFNTPNVTDMSYMFTYCTSLTSLDLSSFNTSKVTIMKYMFGICGSLKTIYVGSGWSTAAVTNSENMFSYCDELVGGQGTVVDEDHMDASYAHIDGGTSNPGYFTAEGAEPWSGPEAYACYTSGNTTLTFFYDTQRDSRTGTTYSLNRGRHGPGWYNGETNASVTKVVFDASFANVRPTSTTSWFEGMENLQSIVGMEYLYTSEVKYMDFMFAGCTSLTSLDISHFNTDKVTRMDGMFYGCEKFTSLDVSHFNTSNVTDMSWMFTDCESLTSLDLSHFNTGKVTKMSYMFRGNALTSLDLSNFNTANVTTMEDMFSDCSALTSLDLSNFNTENVTNMHAMFWGCGALTTLDLSSFNTANVTDMSMMFASCRALKNLNLSNFNTANVTKMNRMFESCLGLTRLDLSSFNTANVTDMTWMFFYCRNLKTVYVGDGWSTTAVTDSDLMFSYCTSLVGGQGTTYDADHVDASYAHIDGGTSNPGYFTGVETYQIWIADKQVTSANMNDVLGDGTVSYDLSTNTLTLNNANIVTAEYAIYLEINYLYIVLEGENTIEGKYYGIISSLKTYIGGAGSLHAKGGEAGIRAYILQIQGGQIMAEGGNYGISAEAIEISGQETIVMMKGVERDLHTNYLRFSDNLVIGLPEGARYERPGTWEGTIVDADGNVIKDEWVVIASQDYIDGISLTPALSSREGEWYDLQGRKVMNPRKGIYIKDGKKVLIK